MNKKIRLLFLVFLLGYGFSQAQNVMPASVGLEFIPNAGQWDGPFLYKSSGTNQHVFFEKNALTFLLEDPANADNREAVQHGHLEKTIEKYHAYQMVFENAKTTEVTPDKIQSTLYNYYLGNNPDKWKTGLKSSLVLDYKNVYEGIDVHISSSEGNIKYDFVVAPGADAQQIVLNYKGTDGLKIKKGRLEIQTTVGVVSEMKPYAFQYIDGVKTEVDCNYRLKDGKVTFEFPDGYHPTSTLIIDPVVVFCTYTGSTSDNWGFTATFDAQGNFYAGGLVNGTGYPVNLGAFQTTFGGGSTTTGSFYPCDMGIMKIDASGANKIYATYIGGSDNDQPHSMIVDNNNNLIIAGRTYSANYPVTVGAYDDTYNGAADIVLTKLSATGTSLLASTFFGGTADDGVNFNADEFSYGELKHNYGDDARGEVLIDNSGNIYLATCTRSSDFPVTPNAIKSSLTGTQDAAILKFDPTLTTLIWSTLFGGSSSDAGYVLAMNNSQNSIYLAGGTSSTDLVATAGAIWPAYQGGSADGFVAKFENVSAYTLQNLTFIGQSDYDQVYGIQTDFDDNVYVMGQTLGGTFPVSSGVYNNPGSSQFIMKMNSDLTSSIFSTVYGSGTSTETNISPVAFLVDTCENIYISGWGGDLGISTVPATVGNTFGMPLSTAPNLPIQPTTDGADFYFIVLSKNALNLLYSTYYGRNSTAFGKGEHVDGGTSRFDKSGIVYQAICGGCNGGSPAPVTNFPTTPGSLSPQNGFPNNCNEVALKIAFNLGAVEAQAQANPDSSGCAPFTVNFQNGSMNALTYTWDFGDGSPVSNLASPQHTFTSPGNYSVRLIAYNPNACKELDTVFLSIHVSDAEVQSSFVVSKVDSCGPYTANFINNSTFSSTPGSQTFTTFTWLFGDGTTHVGQTPPLHNYNNPGTYTVLLIMTDTTACNNPDTAQATIDFNPIRVSAGLSIPDSVCLGEPLVFGNASSNASSYLWDFGDGQTSTTTAPAHVYAAPGVYHIKLVAYNPQSCNKIDSVEATIKILSLPIADFTSSPTIPIPNEPIQFSNASSNAVSYFWMFGDSRSSTDVNPSHLYKKTGKYTVCLVAKSLSGCLDTLCKTVEADVRTAVDVPTAFTPNGDGKNDVLFVRGAAIETIDFKVYNRWGQVVFETKDIEKGWDGKWNGKEQEIESYAFTLEVLFVDGTAVKRQGNVTLIR